MNNEEEQFEIFITLMATRAYPSEKEDAQTQDVETAFNTEKGREAGVLSAWEQYLNILDPEENTNEEIWNEKRTELLIDLLEKIAWVVGYDFNKEKTRSTCTSSIPLENFDEIQEHVREEMMRMLQERYGE